MEFVWNKQKMSNFAQLFVCVACVCTSGSAYLVTVNATAEECFFDKVQPGTKLSLTYQLAEVGLLYIDVRIVGPDNAIIYRVYRRPSGKCTFTAYTPGVYTYCFSNKMSTVAAKVVMFHMAIDEPSSTDVDEGAAAGAEGESNKKLGEMFRELWRTLTGVKREQQYMLVRDRNHWASSESIISSVAICTLVKALILVAMTCGQVYYLKRFFEVQREV